MITSNDRAVLRRSQLTDLVAEVEVDAGFATGTGGRLTDDHVVIDFDTGEPSMTIALDDIIRVRLLGRQVLT